MASPNPVPLVALVNLLCSWVKGSNISSINPLMSLPSTADDLAPILLANSSYFNPFVNGNTEPPSASKNLLNLFGLMFLLLPVLLL